MTVYQNGLVTNTTPQSAIENYGAPIYRAFTEQLHPRGTGAVGGQFVAAGAAKSAPAKKRAQGGYGNRGNLSFDGKRGPGYGSKNGDKRVKALQQALNKLGLTDGAGKALKVDGKLGPRTTAAVKKAQRKLGLKADGVVTPALLRQLSATKSAKDLKKAPAKKATPKKVAAAPAKKAAPTYTRKPKKVAPQATVHRSVSYSGRMTALARHATHNQKSHGNRLGKPSNVAGKTGLGKATAKLEGSPEEGPDRAPATTKKLTSGQTKALNVVKDAGPSGILVDEARRRGAHENSLYALKRAGLLRTAWLDEGGAEVEPPHKTGKRASLYWFTT